MTTLDRSFIDFVGATRTYRTEAAMGTTLVREYRSCQTFNSKQWSYRGVMSGVHGRHLWGVGNTTYICLGDDDAWNHDNQIHTASLLLTDEMMASADQLSVASIVKKNLDEIEKTKWSPLLYVVARNRQIFESWCDRARILKDHVVWLASPSQVMGRHFYEDDVVVIVGAAVSQFKELADIVGAEGAVMGVLEERGFDSDRSSWIVSPEGYPEDTIKVVMVEHVAEPEPQVPTIVVPKSPPRWLRGKKPIGPTPHRRRG